MAKKELIKAASILKELFLKRNLKLNKIIAFGSAVKGNSNKNSDIDIIVVSESFRKKRLFRRMDLVTGINSTLVEKLNRPVDILFYSDKEWEKGNSIIITAAKEHGKIL